MRRLISFRDFDWLLLTFVLIICSLGVLEIYSTTYGTKFAGAHIRQIYWILGGLVVMLAVSLINYQILLENANWFYVASVISLLAVAVFGKKYLGARLDTAPGRAALPAVRMGKAGIDPDAGQTLQRPRRARGA